MERMEEYMSKMSLGRYIAMDRTDELNISVGKLNLLTYTKSAH
jgi:hypothetical protein